MKRAGEPLEAVHPNPFEPPAALVIAASAGAPPGSESVYQYVEDNARGVTPEEENGEPALALSLLLIGQIAKLHAEEHPNPDLVKSFVDAYLIIIITIVSFQPCLT